LVFRGLTINNKNVFATIREVSETLSLSNEPDKLANMALDTVAQVLGVDCCWIQTISDRKHKKLNLAAERGFSPEMRQEIGTMDLSHSFSEQIIGLGHKIIIPDLSNDGLYGIPSFKNTGYKWLVAVPLMTYRAHGILGTASRNRKLLKKETADLIMTIAGIIATSLSKAHFSRLTTAPEKPASEPVRKIKEEHKIQVIASGEPAQAVKKELKTPEKKVAAELTQQIKEEPKKAEKTPEAPVIIKTVDDSTPAKPAKHADGAFHSHARKMELFRKSHR
jgi:hypothetical protein